MKTYFILSVSKGCFSDLFTSQDLLDKLSNISARQLDFNRPGCTNYFQGYEIPKSPRTKKFLLDFANDLTLTMVYSNNESDRLALYQLIHSIHYCLAG